MLVALSQKGSPLVTKRRMQPRMHEWIVWIERSMLVLSILGT